MRSQATLTTTNSRVAVVSGRRAQRQKREDGDRSERDAQCQPGVVPEVDALAEINACCSYISQLLGYNRLRNRRCSVATAVYCSQ